MIGVRTYSRNLAASWIVHGANLVVAFFLTPFVIHTLGDVRYGIWSLVLSVSGWIAMADVGLRHSISKYLNEYLAKGDKRHANELVMTSIVLLVALGMVAVLAAIIVGGFFDRIFKSLAEKHFMEAWIAMGIVGLNFAVGLQSSLSRRILESFNRFDLTNLVMLVGLGIRTGGIVLVLSCGGGLIELALVTLVTFSVEAVAMRLTARRIWPGMRMGRDYIRSREARRLLRFGVPLFFNNIAGMLIGYTDFLIVGILISVEKVTVYSIGYMLISYSRQFLRHIVRVLTPDIFKHAGVEDHAALRHLLVRTANVTAFACIPVFIGFIFFGGEFIRLWMDREPGDSARVLTILTVASFSMLAGNSAGVIMIGLGRARLSAVLAMVEASANLALSLTFVMALGWGLPGVALGTLVSALVMSGVVRPIITCRLIHFGVARFAARTFVRWALAGSCFAAACFAVMQFAPAGSWLTFALKVVPLGLLFMPIGWYILFPGEMRVGLVRKVFGSHGDGEVEETRAGCERNRDG